MKKKCITWLSCNGKYHEIVVMLLQSVVGMIICAICLAGSTWAWFTASRGTCTQIIQSANFSVQVLIDSKSAVEDIILEPGTYAISITANGTATTGYCMITIGDQEKITQEFPSSAYDNNNITFTLVMNESASIEFVSCWGTSIVGEAERIKDGDIVTYGMKSEQPIDTVEENTIETTETTEIEEPEMTETTEIEEPETIETTEIEEPEMIETTEIEEPEMTETTEIEEPETIETTEIEEPETTETTENLEN